MNAQTSVLKAAAGTSRLRGLLDVFFSSFSSASVLGFLLVASLSLSIWAQAPAAGNAIQAVSASLQGDVEVIRIDLTEPLTAVPTGFSIQSPARIALDFPGINNAMGRSTVEINLGNLRSVNVVQAGERTRVVLNLKAWATYKAEIQGKSLFITLDTVVAAAPTAIAPPVFAENRNRDVLPLKDIDFRRGADSSGRIVVDLPNNQVGVDIRQQGQTLVVEFLKTALPEGLRRRLDVADFGTPIQTVTTFQTGDRVRMEIEPKGLWEHSAYQSDNQFVVEVRQQKVDESKLSQGPGYTGKKLSLNFQNILVRDLLPIFAEFNDDLNIVASDSVTGAITLRLKEVPWDQALDIILQAKGLGMKKAGNVLLIAPKEELAKKDQDDQDSRNKIQSLEQVRTQDFKLNYAKAVDISAQIAAGGTGPTSARILSNRGSAIAEARTNQLFVTDIPSRLEQVQSFIAKIDIPVRQVLIEARIVEAADTFGKSLGVRLGGRPFTLNGNRNTQFGSTYIAPIDGRYIDPDTGIVSGEYPRLGSNFGTTAGDFFNLPAVGPFPTATFALSLFNSSLTRLLNLEISAMEADGKGKIVSSPRILTADQKEASVEQGVEIPFQKATTSGATSIEFIKANLSLKVTPQITPEGSVIMDLEITKNSVGQATTAGLAINTKRVKTQVLVENGGTVVIAGIFEQNEQEDVTKVPFFGDLPVVGNLFKTKTRTANKTELLIFISPKIIPSGVALR